jgi:hypothetical protein
VRALIAIHRYLGIALGLLVAGWCLTGFVMMYVSYPQLSDGQRLRGLAPIAWTACCTLPPSALEDAARVDRFEIEMLGDRPVLRLQLAADAVAKSAPAQEPSARAGRRVIDLASGTPIDMISAAEARRIAVLYGRSMGLDGVPARGEAIDYDQWTVSGSFDRDRPLYRFAMHDAAGTELYVSSRTGKVVQATTARGRFWNELGAVPHWIYFAALRRDAALWSEVVIWTSVIGTFLTLSGIYIGVDRLWRAPRGRWSPYRRGALLWHHVPGLLFGVFALTWVVSGLASMTPWGLLEGASARPETRAIEGAPLTGAQIKAALRSLASAVPPERFVSIESAPLGGRLYLIGSTAEGARTRLSVAGAAAPLTVADVAVEARVLRAMAMSRAAAAPSDVRSPEQRRRAAVAAAVGPQLITRGDDYYFDHHSESVRLPAYRIVLRGTQHTRYYFDPTSGAILKKIDAESRAYRWWHQGLHRLDFTRWLRARPLWDVVMWLLLGGTTLVCATGAYLGLTRIVRTRPA